MSNLLTTHICAISTVTANSVAAGQSTYPSVATGVPCYKEPMTPVLAFQNWGVETDNPYLFLFDGLSQQSNLRQEGRILQGGRSYRIKGVRAFDAGVLDHIEVLTDQEQF